MGIKYFYNFCIVSRDNTALDSDILSAVRKSYFNDFDKIRDKITVDSERDSLMYDYCIESGKPVSWSVKASDGAVIQDTTPAPGGGYYINFYSDQKLVKRLLFSRLHTLLRAEYTDDNGSVCCSVEPRKLKDGLCLLYKDNSLPEPLVLSEMPGTGYQALDDIVNIGFTDYTVAASTNEGVLRYLTDAQLTAYESFVAREREALENVTEESFIGDNTPLYDKINVKDFNIKRNLSSALDITEARDFGSKPSVSDSPVEDIADNADDHTEAETEAVPDPTEAEPAPEAPENAVKPDKLIMADGAVYSYFGELDSNGNRSGYGRTLTDLGRTAYEGEYLNDKRSGIGAYFYKDGTLCYSGDWSENARHGIGVGISARDGSMHIGRWVNNKPEGNGVRLSADGEIKFVCKELADGGTVLMNYTEDNNVIVSKYDPEGKKIAEKTVSLTDF